MATPDHFATRPSAGTRVGRSIRSHRAAPFTVAFALLFGMMVLWALASPLMSVPDEQVHAMRSAAVVRGDFTGTLSRTQPGYAEVEIPRYLAESNGRLTCVQTSVATTAACQRPVSRDPDALVTGYTTATLNSPVFYALTGLPSLVLSGNPAIYAMRVVASIICAGLLASAFAVVAPVVRSGWTLLGLGTTVTPMVLFLAGSVNPNAVEVCAAIALFTCLTVVLREKSEGSVLWTRGALIVVSGALLVNTRSIALLWLAIIVGVGLLVAQRPILRGLATRPASLVIVGAGVLLSILALVWFLIPKGLEQNFALPGAGSDWKRAFLIMLDRTLDYGIGWVGYFGWLDTPAPAVTLIAFAVAATVFLVLALLTATARFRMALIAMIVAIVLIPAIVQSALVYEWGFVWQGRYTLAIVACALVLAGFALDEAGLRVEYGSLPGRLITATLALLALGHLAAYVWALRRYVIGLGIDRTWIEMILAPTWEPPGGWVALSVLFSVTCGLSTVALWRSVGPRLSRDPVGTASVGKPAVRSES